MKVFVTEEPSWRLKQAPSLLSCMSGSLFLWPLPKPAKCYMPEFHLIRSLVSSAPWKSTQRCMSLSTTLLQFWSKYVWKLKTSIFFFFWQYKGGVKLLSDYECHIHMPYSYAILLRFHTSSCVLHTLPGNIDHKKILLKVLKHPHTIRKCLPIGGFSLTTCFSWRLWNTQDVVMNTLMKTEQ